MACQSLIDQRLEIAIDSASAKSRRKVHPGKTGVELCRKECVVFCQSWRMPPEEFVKLRLNEFTLARH